MKDYKPKLYKSLWLSAHDYARFLSENKFTKHLDCGRKCDHNHFNGSALGRTASKREISYEYIPH